MITDNSNTTMLSSSTKIRWSWLFVFSRQKWRICGGVRLRGFIVREPLAQLSSFVLKCLLTTFQA